MINMRVGLSFSLCSHAEQQKYYLHSHTPITEH